MDLEHRHPFGFGRMGGDGGTGFRRLERFGHRLPRGTGCGDGRESIGEGTQYLVVAAHRLEPAPGPHCGIFFSNIKKLQPDSDDLKRRRDEVGLDRSGVFGIVDDGKDAGRPLADHAAQQVAQEDGDLVHIAAIHGQNMPGRICHIPLPSGRSLCTAPKE
jgi:hypothetical protein